MESYKNTDYLEDLANFYITRVACEGEELISTQDTVISWLTEGRGEQFRQEFFEEEFTEAQIELK